MKMREELRLNTSHRHENPISLLFYNSHCWERGSSQSTNVDIELFKFAFFHPILSVPSTRSSIEEELIIF